MKKTPQNQPKQKVTPKAQARKATTVSGKTQDPDLSSYALALTSPFDKMAVGARVPDMYSYPTATYHAEGTFTVTSTSGGTASFLLGPHPYLSLVDITNSTSSNGMANYAGFSAQAWAAATAGNLDSVLTNFRLVGAGFQFRNLMPPTTATGRIILAKVPATGPIPGPGILGAVACNYGNGIVPLYCGISTGASTTGFATDILELPDAQEFTIQDIIDTAVEVSLKPLSPAAFDFYDTSNDTPITAGDSMVGGDIIINATGVVPAGTSSSINGEIVRGWDCLLLNANGFPASTVIFEVKYIYHFEGTPFLSSNAGVVAPGVSARRHINPAGHAAVLSAVLNQPSMRMITSAVGTMADAYFGSGTTNLVSKLGSSVLSKLGITF